MHVFLTGASSGIGEALALAMARPGAKLTLVARRAEELKRVAKLIGERADVLALPGDLSKLDDLEELLGKAVKKHGPIDVLVNNAGIEKVGRITEVTIAEGEHLLRVNLLAPLRLIQMLAPEMVARRAGCIINVTSIAGLAPLPYATHYSASKAALSSASEHLNLELAKDGVHVYTVYPGPIVTPMGERAAASYERDALPRALWGTVEGLAKAVVKGMGRRDARLVYPRMYGVHRWFPNLTRWASFQLAPPPVKKKSGG
jgi:short-subunit dehydrogenase